MFNGTFGMHGELSRELSAFVESGGLVVALTKEEARSAFERIAHDPAAAHAQVAAAKRFMDREFSFDGHASQKLADAIRQIVRETARPAGVL